MCVGERLTGGIEERKAPLEALAQAQARFLCRAPTPTLRSMCAHAVIVPLSLPLSHTPTRFAAQVFRSGWEHERAARRDHILEVLAQNRHSLAQYLIANSAPRPRPLLFLSSISCAIFSRWPFRAVPHRQLCARPRSLLSLVSFFNGLPKAPRKSHLERKWILSIGKAPRP